MSRVTLTLSAFLFAAFVSVSPVKAVEVYLFKGAGDFSFINKNMHFSRGLDRIAEQLNSEGIHAEVRRYGSTRDAMRTIRRRKPKSVAFIGHSMGALASMSMARRMRAEGIRVAYVGTLDIPGPIGSAGRNVEWAENYFSITPVYGLLTNVSSHPKAKNIHVFGMHTTMDDSKKVKNGVLAAIRQIHAAEGNAVTPEPVETIMVENVQPETAKVEKSVEVATLPPKKRLLKIDEEPATAAVVQPVATEQANISNNGVQKFALASTGSLENTALPIPPSAELASDLMPINLLSAPPAGYAPVLQPATFDEPQKVRQAILEPEIEQPQIERKSVFSRGRITSAGRSIVAKISGMLARNGRRHDRKVEEIQDMDR